MLLEDPLVEVPEDSLVPKASSESREVEALKSFFPLDFLTNYLSYLSVWNLVRQDPLDIKEASASSSAAMIELAPPRQRSVD